MIIENILAAADSLITIQTMALMVLGVAAGLIAGAIPGFTITMAVVLTLPFTFGMSPIQGLATMGGSIRWGAFRRPDGGYFDWYPRHPFFGSNYF